MQLEEALTILRENRNEIAAYGVTSISIFGSVARGEAGPGSDIDLLVEFGCPIGLFKFVRLKNYLEGILDSKVDLAMVEGLRAQMRDKVLKEAVRAA